MEEPPLTPTPVRRARTSGRLSGDTLVLLEASGEDLNHLFAELESVLWAHGDVDHAHLEEVSHVLQRHADLGPDALSHGVAIVHEKLRTPGPGVQALIRVGPELRLDDAMGVTTRFLWVLLSEHVTHPAIDRAAEFAHLCADPTFVEAAMHARTPEELDEVYGRGLDEEIHFHPNVAEELRPTGKWFGALRADIARKIPTWGSDWRDGLNTKALASTIFLFFACLAPSVAFGGLLSVMTNGSIGVVETMLATAVTGVLYALFSGQPLSILGSTGPIVAFLGILYAMCGYLGIPYLPTMAWVGLWTSFFLLVLVAFDGASLIRFFTRFTFEVFAALIALIYLWEAVRDISKVFTDHQVAYATALLSLVLSLGTYQVATALRQFRRSPYLRRAAREFLADFGPTIAIFVMTAVAFMMHEVELETLAVPDTFTTTSGRAWFVNPFSAPRWVWGWAALPAVMGAVLVYLDHNITIRLVNNPSHKLQKGSGYHLDLLIVAVLVGVFSLFGLPWTVAATVRSLNHVRSLETVEEIDGKEKVIGVMEQRVTQMGVHLLIGGSLLLLPLMKLIPTSVLFGLFLYMGVASMGGNRLFERLRLWITDPTHYPITYYLRAVPERQIHKYTIIQTVMLALLWGVKASPLGIVFPLFIALLVPVRMGIERFFKAEHLALLDAEEEPEEEIDADIGA